MAEKTQVELLTELAFRMSTLADELADCVEAHEELPDNFIFNGLDFEALWIAINILDGATGRYLRTALWAAREQAEEEGLKEDGTD